MRNNLKQQFKDYVSRRNDRLSNAIKMSDAHLIGLVFNEWNAVSPDFHSVVETTIETLSRHCDAMFSPQELSILKAATELASEENVNPFHGNAHFLKVFTLTAFLGADALREGRISSHQLALVLASALIHDYKHDGTTNNGQKYRLEDIALTSAKSRLLSAGVTKDDWGLIEAFVRTTDVSKDFSDKNALSPSETVKLYSVTGSVEYLLPELRIIADTKTADLALIIEDADLASSLINVEQYVSSGIALATERGQHFDVNGQKFFFENICHKRMFSISGMKLIQPEMQSVFEFHNLNPDHGNDAFMQIKPK